MADRAKAKRLATKHLKCNKPKKTPSHKTKSHVVKACDKGEEKMDNEEVVQDGLRK